MDDVEGPAWMSLVAVAELLPTALDAQLRTDAGISHVEFMALSALKQAEGNTLRVKELAAAANATMPRLSKLITRLESRGLVERSAGGGDGRAINVTLTSAGRRVLVRALPGHVAYVRSLVLDRLTSAQLAALTEALRPVLDELDPQRSLTRGALRD